MLKKVTNKIKNRYKLHTQLEPFCRKQLAGRTYTPANTITLFAQPRSGSTWLAELLSSDAESILLNEPLWRGLLRTNGSMPSTSSGKIDEIRALNFYYYQPIPEQASWPGAERCFNKLFRGGVCKLGLYKLNTFSQLPKAQNFVVKFCYGNLLFHWLLARFDIKPIVLIRHPCAVVASQLQHYAWAHIRNEPVFQIANFRHNHYFLRYFDVLKHIHTPEGILAALWAINAKAIEETHQHTTPWYTLAYERLLLDRENELTTLFQWLGKEAPLNIYEKAAKASTTSSLKSRHILETGNPDLQLGKWQQELNQRQRSNIMAIVKDIGIPYYSVNELEPDYSFFSKKS
jgi:hypothetical protein